MIKALETKGSKDNEEDKQKQKKLKTKSSNNSPIENMLSDINTQDLEDKIIEDIKINADLISTDIRLKKLKKLPWGKILGGIFGFSFYTIYIFL